VSEEEFRFPKIVVHEIVEDDDRLFRESLTSPVCDFCMDERVKWSYNCADFSIVLDDGETWGSHNGWAVCDQCSEFVEKQVWPNLTVRVLRSWSKLGSVLSQEKIDNAWAIVSGFLQHYVPGREPFG